MNTKWEYRVVNLIEDLKNMFTESNSARQWIQAADFEMILNKYGIDGWELVNIQILQERRESVIIGFFKRPLL